jgi:hypothetical protein
MTISVTEIFLLLNLFFTDWGYALRDSPPMNLRLDTTSKAEDGRFSTDESIDCKLLKFISASPHELINDSYGPISDGDDVKIWSYPVK